MLRPAVIIAAIVALGSGAAVAKDNAPASPLEGAFRNTIVSTYADGRTAELWLAPDGGYTAEGRRHDPSRGHWSVKGGRLCLKQVRPIPMLFSFCTPIPQAGIGQSWPAKAASGESITVRVAKGHFDPGRTKTRPDGE